MILKLVKQEIRQSVPNENGMCNCGSNTVVEYHEGEKIVIKDNMARIDDKETVDIGEYHFTDEISKEEVTYRTRETYLMNNNGQTVDVIR
jgi:hypothetical protein